MPTPMAYQLIKDSSRFNFCIVISASHNPYYDNGIKLFDAKASKLTKKDEAHITTYFEEWYAKEQNNPATQSPEIPVEIWTAAEKHYQDKIVSHFPANVFKGIKVVLDCAHGATAHIAPAIFTQLGAEVIAIADQPTGTNINEKCGATHPEDLQKKVVAEKAHVGFAFDGDGDRIIAVTKTGTIKNGDDVLFLLQTHPEYKAAQTIVGTVMSNQGFEQALAALGKKLIRTKVGDRYVAEALVKDHLSIGGEISGHTIIRDYMPTSDGIFVALKVLEAVIINQNWDLTTFNAFPQVLLNIPIQNKKDLAVDPFPDIIATYEKLLPTGRILVRYSGTENILRVMTEAESLQLAQTTAQELAQELQKFLTQD